jgi:uncharacterized membrane protein YagU involved in acid resistance
LDGLSACLLSVIFGGSPIRTFQGIASGLVGRAACSGGTGAAAVGIALHFLVAFAAAAVFYAASRRFSILAGQAILCGVLYGIAVHLFMQFVVIPLSAIGRRPLVWRSFLAVLIVHMIVVGPSIALTVRRYSR